LTVLDPGEAQEAAQRLRAAGHDGLADEVGADAFHHRSALLTILRKQPPNVEESLLSRRSGCWTVA
jgi:hypothetical protein